MQTTQFFTTATCALAFSGCYGSTVSSGPYDLFPPTSSSVEARPTSSPNKASFSGSGVDVVIERDGRPGCAVVSDGMYNRAEQLLARAIEEGFGHFPIDREAYRASVMKHFFADASVCTALMGRTGATPANHNRLRAHYKQKAMDETEAAAKGLVAQRVPVRVSCPPGYNWSASPVYNGVASCDDVTSKIGPGVPTALYALPLSPEKARHYLTHPSAPALYSRYSNGGPVMCDGYTKSVSDAVHSLYVSSLWSDLHFIMRTWEADGWSAWNLRRSCSINGTTYSYDDLIFDFGMRAYLPISVEIEGTSSTMTLIISGVAAASNSWAAGLLPDDLPYERWIGGEFAKKLLVEGWSQGWDVR
jgi:hypothetical protein